MKVNKLLYFVFLLSVFFISSCSSQGRLEHESNLAVIDVYDEVQDADVQLFAKTIAESRDNQSLVLEKTPFGHNVSIKIEKFYINALGQKCRRATALLEDRKLLKNFVVCLDNSKNWHYVESLT